MNREEIDNMIIEIMIKYGPDGHIDGHDVLTEYVMCLLENRPFNIEKVKRSF